MTDLHENHVTHLMNSDGQHLKMITSCSACLLSTYLDNFENIEANPHEVAQEEEAKETGMEDGGMIPPENICYL